jgi:uncharacterized protein YndB with AHSA1/START domain
MLKTNLQQQTFIDALPSKVWKVLTNPDYINQYLFEGTVQCQWTEGSSLTLMTQTEETTKTVLQGKVLQIVPGTLLKFNLHDEAMDHFAITTFELIPAAQGIELKYYYESIVETNEDYFSKIQQAKLLLQQIKWLAEYA